MYEETIRHKDGRKITLLASTLRKDVAATTEHVIMGIHHAESITIGIAATWDQIVLTSTLNNRVD